MTVPTHYRQPCVAARWFLFNTKAAGHWHVLLSKTKRLWITPTKTEMLTKTHDTQEVCLNVSVLSQPERHSNKLLNRSFTSGASVLHQPKEWKVGKSRVNSFFKHESESIEFLIMQVWKGSHFWRTINILTVLFWGVSLLTAWNSRHRLPHALWRIKAPRKRYISRGYKLAWSAAAHGSHLIASVTLCLFSLFALLSVCLWSTPAFTQPRFSVLHWTPGELRSQFIYC